VSVTVDKSFECLSSVWLRLAVGEGCFVGCLIVRDDVRVVFCIVTSVDNRVIVIMNNNMRRDAPRIHADNPDHPLKPSSKVNIILYNFLTYVESKPHLFIYHDYVAT